VRRILVGAVVALGVALGGGALGLFGGGGESSSPAPTVAPVGGDGLVQFVFTSETVAGFVVTEELRGSPNVVVGISDRVVGRVAVDPSDPASVRLGEILVDARAFDTGSGLRDRALRGLILETDAFPFIVFTPTRVEELETPAEGVTATVVGDLTVRGVTRPVSFAVTVALEGDRLVGSAEATVSRSDFGVEIPSGRGVANVTDTVELFIEFVARRT